MNQITPSSPSLMPVVLTGTVWLMVVLAGALLLTQYSLSAGSAGSPPQQWPTTSRVPLESGLPKLVLFLHPRCPCSRATLGELEQLMAHCQGRLSAEVLFIRPEGVAENWEKTDLWTTAEAIPGVEARADQDGVEARLFQAETSGQTLLYDASGHLLFHGGITLSRGHAGDNPGRSALEALLWHELVSPVPTPVFGCALTAPATQKECPSCNP